MFKQWNVDKFGRTSFTINGLDLSIVNALRRTILTDIPNVGFRADPPSLEILKNNGPLHNEFLLHRMSMIPLHLSEEEVENWDENTMTFELDVENKSEVMTNVTTLDIKIEPPPKGNNKKIFPHSAVTKPPSGILITRLRPKEELHIRGKAVKGTAREHAGFSPVSLCTYSFVSDGGAAGVGVLERERAFKRNE